MPDFIFKCQVTSQPGGLHPLRFDLSLPQMWPNVHVYVNDFSLGTVQNVIMLNVQTQYFKEGC